MMKRMATVFKNTSELVSGIVLVIFPSTADYIVITPITKGS